MGIFSNIISNSFSRMRIHTGWYLVAFAMSLTVPTNGIILSVWYGIFGRLYIIYWLIVYHEMYIPWIKKLITLANR